MKSLRLVLASLILALYWWVSPRKKPGPPKGYKRKAKQAALMEDLAAAWKANGPDSTPSPLAEAPGDVDQFSPEVVA